MSTWQGRRTGLVLFALLLLVFVAGLGLGDGEPAAAAALTTGTATRTPSRTPTPSHTPTATPIPRRLVSRALAGPLAIDGDLADWPADGWFYLNDQTARHAGGPVGDWRDTSLDFQSLHDGLYLYLAFRVSDDHIYTDSFYYYHDDAVEIGLDGVLWDPDDLPRDYDDYQFQIRADGAITETIHRQAGLDGVLSACRQWPDGYRIELAVPLAKLGYPSPYVAGVEIGLNFALRDDDDGGNYDASLFWEALSTQNSGPDYGRLLPLGDLEWQELRLQEGVAGYFGSEDTFLSEWEPTTPQDPARRLELHLRSGGDRPFKSPLLRFGLSGLPPEAIITRAVLELRVVNGPPDRPRMIVEAYRVRRHWVEEQATWQQAALGSLWALPGCESEIDRDSTPVSAAALAQADGVWRVDLSLLADLWLHGQAANEGVLLRPRSPEGRNMEYVLASSESTFLGYRPALVLGYYVAQPTPTCTPTETPTPSPTNTPSPTPTVVTGALTVWVCEDLDGDAACSALDRGLSGAVIQVLDPGGRLHASWTTDAQGLARFPAVPAGQYRVREVNPPGYASLWDDEWEVHISEGDELVLYFIDYAVGTPTPAWSHRLQLPLVER